eukprot:CAMPEP_0114476932 /NCGR_PEP_ID=MMETSP0104-20121206/15052_1 /TAXON_ID=37642 ORGANISM="Paraphysomonas imperforata, Strain PA2" /NCGR_SAMPLE_ID=MMETSP0104 /ASSEMBLY_ACC=CAM_ASM_000202 /LENGTH=1256 /DNA_ID=CAMNT_0001651763 /DNA_START=82 /DNA_END=3854 /DNA_ORIENTATION=-
MQKFEEHDIVSFINSKTVPKDSVVIDECYDAVLEAQMVPPQVGKRYLKLHKQIKNGKQLILAFYSMMGNEAMVLSGSFGDSDKTVLDKLKTTRTRPDMADVLNMKSRISTANKAFMEAWIAADGMVILVRAIEERCKPHPMGEVDIALLYEMICSMKIVINTGITMEIFLATEGAVQAVTSSLLLAGCKPLALQVLELLAVLCDYSSSACAEVVCYLRDHSKKCKERSFSMLVNAIHDDDVEVKAAVLQFINSMLGGTVTLEDRMLIRNDLNALGFSHVTDAAVRGLEADRESISHGQHQVLDEERPSLAAVKSVAISSEALPIDPAKGVMSGFLIASKHQGGMLRAIGAGKTTKRRWFVLDRDHLSWWHPDEIQGPPAGFVEIKDVVEIHSYGHGEDLYKLTPHLFEVVTSARTHAFGVEAEEAKQNWITAITVRMDKNILAKSSYSLTSAQINQCEFVKFAAFFLKQIKIYEAISEADHSDSITASGVAMAEPVEMIKYIESELSSVGLGKHLVHALQEFMVLPVDSAFAEEYWTCLVKMCQDLRELKGRHGELTDNLKSSLLTTEMCIHLFDKKEKSTGGKAVMEMNRLKLQVFTKDEEIERLKNELAAGGGIDRSSQRVVSRTKSSSIDLNNNDRNNIRSKASSDASPLKSQVSAPKIERDSDLIGSTETKRPFSAENPSTTPPPPPPPPKQEERSAPKPGKLGGAEGSALGALFGAKGGGGRGSGANARAATSDAGKKPAVVSTRPIPAPPALPPGAASLLGLSDASLPKCPVLGQNAWVKKAALPVSKHKASRKMKGVFWNKVKSTELSVDNMWKNIDLKQLDDLELDYACLEESFGQVKPAEVVVAASSSSSNVDKKEVLLDGKRTQNVLITYGKIRKTPEKMVEMITEMDPIVLTFDVTELLQNVVPTAEEVTMLTNYSGHTSTLAQAEQNLMVLLGVPRLQQRLMCHKIVFVWMATANRLLSECDLIAEACRQMLSPTSAVKLEKVLSVVLAVGNFMNGGSSRVAEAVTIDSIIKFNNVKATDNKQTLLHFVVKQLKAKFPDALDFYEDWSVVYNSTGAQSAADLSFTSIMSEKKSLADDIKKIEDELVVLRKLAAEHPDAVEAFAERTEISFLPDAKKLLEELHARLSSCEKMVKSTLAQFGYKVSADEDLSKSFFTTIVEIISLMKKSSDDVDKWQEQERKAAEKAAKTASKGAGIDQSEKEVDKKDQQNIFGNFRNQQQASSDDIILQLKKKMELRRLKAEAAQ